MMNPFHKLQSAIGKPCESDYAAQALLIFAETWAGEMYDSRKSDLNVVLEKIDELPACPLTREMRLIARGAL